MPSQPHSLPPSPEPPGEGAQGPFRSLVQHAADLLIVSDAEGTVRYVSPASERVLGRPPAELVGTTPIDLVHLDDVDQLAASFAEKAGLPGAGKPIEFRIRHADGAWRWLEGVTTNLLDDDAVAGMVISARDVTERRELEQQLAHRALHDPLTGLPNRALLLDRLYLALGRLRRHRATVTVLLLDLDHFKSVNDALGHDVGDRLLTAVGRRLATVVRPEDTVARLGGDEFVVVCQEVSGGQGAARIAERIAVSFGQEFRIDGRAIPITPSIGMVTTSRADTPPDQLLRDADVAMYQAKRKGRNRYELYDPAMHERAAERTRAEARLRRAVDDDDLRLRYQPVLDAASGRVVGAEAFVHWQDPDEGALTPEEVADLAEYNGQVVAMGHRVLRRASHAAARLAGASAAGSDPWVGVNVAARHLVDPAFGDQVAAALDETGAPRGALCLELSVGTLSVPGARGTVARIRRHGVRIAIDDFGAGELALDPLRDHPADILKLDRTWVAGLADSPADTEILRAVTRVAGALGVMVVATGVRDCAQTTRLLDLGCQAVQGPGQAGQMSLDELLGQLT